MLVKMDQNNQWRMWRHRHIGASDVAAIMGVSPWKTELQLWEEKIEPLPDTITSFSMEKGKALEPTIRAMYEKHTNKSFPATVFEDDTDQFLCASLDGYNEELNRICELKNVGSNDFNKATFGEIPNYYMWQIQTQLACSKALACDYVAYCEKLQDISIIEVLPDEKQIEEMRKKTREFWKKVQTKEPPAISDRDYKTVSEASLCSLLDEWSNLDATIKDLEKRHAELKDKIILLLPHKRIKYNDLRIFETRRKGSIQYKNVPALKGLDLEAYRGDTVVSWNFRFVQNKGS